MVNIKRRDRGGVSILELVGRLMGGPDAELFQKHLDEMIAAGRLHVVVDLSQVSWINSSGLGVLIAAYTALKDRGGRLKLLAVSRRIDQILGVTKLNTVFESYADEETAVGSFQT